MQLLLTALVLEQASITDLPRRTSFVLPVYYQPKLSLHGSSANRLHSLQSLIIKFFDTMDYAITASDNISESGLLK